MEPAKPLVIFDGRCGFCRIWIDYWKQLTGSRVEYAASQDAAADYPQIPGEGFSQAVYVVYPDGSYSRGARAVFETLGKQRVYESVPGLAPLAEWAYGIIAQNRGFFYWVTRLTFGRHIEPARFARTQWVFLKLLAAIYAVAFASLGVQVTGLIGERGISPAREFLRSLAASYGDPVYFAAPTLFWFGASDGALRWGCWTGVAVALVLFAGFFERAALVLLYALYLSYSMAGQIFLGYQWDALLLECGFLAIFLGRSARHQKVIAWLFRFLAFRLYLLSGWVKLQSGDPSWRGLTAVGFHYHTQPLPTPLAWYADHLPAWFQRASTAGVLGIELFCPFLIFAPRMWRMAGAWILLGLQAAILATGNYTFFNVLTMAITVFLFDDHALERIPAVRRAVRPGSLPATTRARMGGTWLAVILMALGATRMYEAMSGALPRPLAFLANSISQFQVVNTYGLFAVMTVTRPEIAVEGSDDGEHWQAYEFRYKPGTLNTAPRWVAPHQPRLDWQMWFAALGDYRASPWFSSFVEKLLRGEPEVTALLKFNPFPQRPPRYIRATLYEYWFTDSATRAQTGAWWKREARGMFFPPVSLR
jgi:predicted DCC family thiol-disulfide oxidoreductase YuxK